MSDERCRHELLPGQCADCRGLVEDVTAPFAGLLIERFYQSAKHEQSCAMSANGLHRHVIAKGDPFALAVHDTTTGRPPFPRLGYVCAECTNKIAHGTALGG